MDERLKRFKFCDPWLYPHLDSVLSRLPENLKEEIINNEGVQIISDATFPDICGRCLHFEQPIEFLIYLNPGLIKQPNVRLGCSIAMELANYVANKEGSNGNEQLIQDLLISWGFEKEVDAASFCNAVSRSKTFKSGYEWARKQNKDYLMLHFGIYYDEWNTKGLAKMSKDRLEKLRTHIDSNHLLPTAAAKEEKSLPEGVSFDEVFTEGIMSAIKEMEFQN